MTNLIDGFTQICRHTNDNTFNKLNFEPDSVIKKRTIRLLRINQYYYFVIPSPGRCVCQPGLCYENGDCVPDVNECLEFNATTCQGKTTCVNTLCRAEPQCVGR